MAKNLTEEKFDEIMRLMGEDMDRVFEKLNKQSTDLERAKEKILNTMFIAFLWIALLIIFAFVFL